MKVSINRELNGFSIGVSAREMGVIHYALLKAQKVEQDKNQKKELQDMGLELILEGVKLAQEAPEEDHEADKNIAAQAKNLIKLFKPDAQV